MNYKITEKESYDGIYIHRGEVGDFLFYIEEDREFLSPFFGTNAFEVSIINKETLTDVFYWIDIGDKELEFPSQEVEKFVRDLVNEVCKKIIAPIHPDDIVDDFL